MGKFIEMGAEIDVDVSAIIKPIKKPTVSVEPKYTEGEKEQKDK